MQRMPVFLVTTSLILFMSGSFAKAAIYTQKVSGDFRKKVEQVAQNLAIDPDYLVAVMALETAKPTDPGKGTSTFDPAIRNPTSKAVGLIQFTPVAIKDLQQKGVLDKTRSVTELETQLSQMSQVDQMNIVQAYLLPYKGKMTRLVDVYLAVLYPAAVGKPNSFLLPDWAYTGNEGFDTDGDGKISVGEIASKIQSYFDKGK